MKEVIRLTESDFHAIIAEAVQEALNEIGDTYKGQYMLGRASARDQKRRGAKGENDGYGFKGDKFSAYAYNKRMTHPNFKPEDTGMEWPYDKSFLKSTTAEHINDMGWEDEYNSDDPNYKPNFPKK